MYRRILKFTWPIAALVIVLNACNKDDKDDPKPKDPGTNTNNNNNTAVEIVEPATTPGSKGSIKFVYNEQAVTYAAVRAKDGKIWMQQNLGSTRVATSMTDEAAYGDLFQWGRWSDGHQIRKPAPEVKSSSSLSANNPSGLPSGGSKYYYGNWWSGGSTSDKWEAGSPASVSATNGCDPCKVLGNDWRLPTKDDWKKVVQLEGIINNQTAFESNLKIPTGGWRATASASISSAGSSSWYWSTDVKNGGNAYGVWIQSNSILPEYPDSRAYGTSVRCVKD